jgi:predicted GTPase
MLKSRKPVVAVGAIRTGCGKSQTTIKLVKILTKLGKKVVVVRHPMPYKDWNEVQRFESYEDLKKCTIEEREEFEPLLREKVVAFEGVDYEKILHKAEEEGDIILWDGGNNDFPFYKPDLFIVVVDPLRPGDEHLYHPGETCLRMANVVIINKIDSAKEIDIKRVRDKVKELNPKAQVIEAKSPITLDNEAGIKDKDILIVEDGPTLTHGEMEYGAGFVAAKKFGARKIIDPRPYAIGSIAKVYEKYSSTGNVLPAMGYSAEQIKELETTINNSPCDTVIIATPSDIRKFMTIKKPCVKVTYKLEEISSPNLEEILTKWLNRGV